MKTCVLPFSRRNGFEWTIRSRSRWNGVRTPHSVLLAQAAGRFVAADGERRQRALLGGRCARGGVSRRRRSGTTCVPASSGVPNFSRRARGKKRGGGGDDDRDGAAVRAPRRAGDVATRAPRAERRSRRRSPRAPQAGRAAGRRRPWRGSARAGPCWSASPPWPSQASVAVGPGATALQRIPSPA